MPVALPLIVVSTPAMLHRECVPTLYRRIMNRKIAVVIFSYNEGGKIKSTLSKFPTKRYYDIILMNDGSTDGSIEQIHTLINQLDVTVLSHDTNRGIGRAMKTAFRYVLSNGYEIIIIMAGNDKDNPKEIPRLLKPLLFEGYDFVQGSRFIKGGIYGKMPLYRILSTKMIHPLLFSIIVQKRVTESTNGFRAFKTSILKDKRINWEQDWLDKYELEPYLLYKVYRLGYKVTEVPVTKIYPPKKLGYTKMKPIIGWWSILKPLIFLGLHIKK